MMRSLKDDVEIQFDKISGLIPAIIQDGTTGKVLMLGYMNQEALSVTRESERVTFYSRSKQRLWTKGETSGNYLQLLRISIDCDGDTLLIEVKPHGPTCHTGEDTCFNDTNTEEFSFLYQLQALIEHRKHHPKEGSYTNKLFKKGLNKIVQKFGEEAIETVIEAKDDDPELLLNESADLLYHFLVLLSAKNTSLQSVVKVLRERH